MASSIPLKGMQSIYSRQCREGIKHMDYCCISLWPNKRQHNEDERHSLLEKYTSPSI